MTPSSDSDLTYEQIMERVKSRAREVRSSPGYDPRAERELDELYNRYIPPYASQGTESLIDIAERDAYVDAIPPLGSQKKGGVIIKKTIRSAIGWYMQFLTQQISTFGTGVARALRSMSDDIEDIKQSLGTGRSHDLVKSLELYVSDDLGDSLRKIIAPDASTRILISDSLSPSSMKLLSDSQLTVIEPRDEIVNDIDPTIDVRTSDITSFLSDAAGGSYNAIVLSGLIECIDPRTRYEILHQSSRVCSASGKVCVIVAREQSPDMALACDLLGTRRWDKETWKKVLTHLLGRVDVAEVGSYDILSGVISSND